MNGNEKRWIPRKRGAAFYMVSQRNRVFRDRSKYHKPTERKNNKIQGQ